MYQFSIIIGSTSIAISRRPTPWTTDLLDRRPLGLLARWVMLWIWKLASALGVRLAWKGCSGIAEFNRWRHPMEIFCVFFKYFSRMVHCILPRLGCTSLLIIFWAILWQNLATFHALGKQPGQTDHIKRPYTVGPHIRVALYQTWARKIYSRSFTRVKRSRSR